MGQIKKSAASSGPEQKAKGKPRGKPFKKGTSGNPGGLSAERRAFLSDVRREEEPHVRVVLAKLRQLASEGAPWAITDYLDRLGMRMPEKLELTGEDGAALNGTDPLARMSTGEKRAELEGLLALAKGQPAKAEGNS